MRSRLLLLGIAAALGTASGVAYCKTVKPDVAPKSMQLTRAGEALLEGNKAQAAIDSFETALAVDPRNVRAYVGLARAHDTIGLPGRAVKFYREALSIDPNDLTALEEQGRALVERGATGRAKENLERIRTICAAECDYAKRLAAAIAKGPPPVVTAANKLTAAPKATN
jgi:Tfp pilus assembly protein PilF